MATQLFLTSTVADTHLGTDNAKLDTTNSGWGSVALSTSRGSGVLTATAFPVTGPTNGIEVRYTALGAFPAEWISPPLAADVTISGTITLNIWAAENNMADNVAINAVIEVIRANATATRNSNTLVEIVKTARVTEVAVTTRAVNNFTATPTSTVVNRGDRLRIRIFGDDVGTMAVNANAFNISFNGTSAAADGDTYVTFTENFSFESAPGTSSITSGAATTTSLDLGVAAGTQRHAATFTASGDTITSVRLDLAKVGSPADNLILEIWSDSGGVPGSSVGTVATVTGASLTTTQTTYTYSGLSIAVTASATYWLVFRRSGAVDGSNRPRTYLTADVVTGPVFHYDGSNWAASSFVDIAYVITATSSSSITTLYPTVIASDVATASDDREAWTSRGAGITSSTTNTTAGWTAPIHSETFAGSGTTLDWFTKQLTAFTLGGLAVVNIWGRNSNASANASLRCEIARVDSDGTNATIWGSWCMAPTGTDNGEFTTTDAQRTINVSGDDLAFTNGQRIRIRVYVDDISSAAMATSFTARFTYALASAGASGDTYITLPQTVTEYTPPAAGGPAPRRRRPAHRYATLR